MLARGAGLTYCHQVETMDVNLSKLQSINVVSSTRSLQLVPS